MDGSGVSMRTQRWYLNILGSKRSLVISRQRVERGGGVAARRGASRAASGNDGPAWLGCEGGDASGQGNGCDERDDGFVEQHCEECSMKGFPVFFVFSRY